MLHQPCAVIFETRGESLSSELYFHVIFTRTTTPECPIKPALRGGRTPGPRWPRPWRPSAPSSSKHDALGADLREALFSRAMPEFFALPRDLKRRLVSGAVNGYIGRRPIRGRASGRPPTAAACATWETTSGHTAILRSGMSSWSGSLSAEMDLKKTKIFTLPCDRPECSDTVARFAKNMQDLQRKLGTMILESLGVQRSTSSRTSKHSPTTSGWCTTARCPRRGRRPACPCNPTGNARGWSYTYSSMSADIDDFVQN
jgi:hypothetical protein